MNSLDILWITSSPEGHLANDPLVQALPNAVIIPIVTPSSEPPDELAARIEIKVRRSILLGSRPAIIIDAFLEPEKEGVKAGQWRPNCDRLVSLVASGGKERLKSLDLMWSVWLKVRRKAPILITTNGIGLSTDSQSALQSAFSSGKAAMVYSWQSKEQQLHSIAQRVTQ